MPRLHGIDFTSRFNAYDRFTIGAAPSAGNRFADGTPDLELGTNEIWLFGNRNVGIFGSSNLQVPGHLASDHTCYIEHWYARHDVLPDALSLRQKADLHAFASSAMVTLTIGDRPVSGWTRPLTELLADRPWTPASVLEAELTPELLKEMRAVYTKRQEEGMVPAYLPVRQSMHVSIGGYDHEAFNRFVESMDGRNVKLWLHVEGVRRDYAC